MAWSGEDKGANQKKISEKLNDFYGVFFKPYCILT